MADTPNVNKGIFAKIAAQRPNYLTDPQKARQWLRDTAQAISRVNVSKLFADNQNNMVNQINISDIGRMFMFSYDPKWKDRLPYYDTLPLVFPIEIYNDGFLGINLHYLSPFYRAKLMDALYDTMEGQGTDKAKLNISYQILKGVARFKYFGPCIHRYLSDHVRSQFFFVEPNKWDITLMLPTQRFVGSYHEAVWAQSQGSF